MQNVTHTWLAGGAVLAALHLPEGGASVGVVVCPPLGQDHIVGYRTLRHLADELARGGLGALRFDYPGHGDSAAAMPDDTLEAGAALAAAALRDAGCTRIVYLGLGSGALAASAAAVADESAAGLVLWDPVPSGRQWLRRQRSFYTLALGDDAVAAEDGTVVLIGVELPETAAEHIAALDFDPALADRMPVLVARREGAAGAVPKALRAVEGRLAVIEVPGHEESLDASSVTATIPAESVRRVAAWLTAAYAPAGGSDPGAATPPAFRPETAVTFSGDDDSEGGVAITETLVRVGPDRLFGIETRPLDAAPDAPAVILHSGSSEHRIGATRYQVLLARRLAAHGVRVLRVDRRGTGETGDVSPDEANLLFSREWIEDGDAAVEHLGLPSDRVGIVGMCVGGWVGLQGRPGTTRFISVLAPNDYRRNPVQPGFFAEHHGLDDVPVVSVSDRARRAARHLVNRAVAVAKVRAPYPALVAAASRGWIRLAEPVLRPALSAGTDVLLYLSPGDREIFEAHGGPKASRRLATASGHLTIVNRDSGDHSLFGPGIRTDAVDWVVDETLREFGLSATAGGGVSGS
jgi:alpha-beta hydrolase superfamily lysophospholipase